MINNRCDHERFKESVSLLKFFFTLLKRGMTEVVSKNTRWFASRCLHMRVDWREVSALVFDARGHFTTSIYGIRRWCTQLATVATCITKNFCWVPTGYKREEESERESKTIFYMCLFFYLLSQTHTFYRIGTEQNQINWMQWNVFTIFSFSAIYHHHMTLFVRVIGTFPWIVCDYL